jgi:hypothetical protein
MYCPKCLKPSEPGATVCPNCKADMWDLNTRVFAGEQFVFAAASEKQPIALSLDGGEPQVMTAPTILSRHLHNVGLGEYFARRTRTSRPPPEGEPGLDLPRLPAPAGPNLAAVITERKIYRPKEEARIFLLAPDAPGLEVEMEVLLAGQQITKERVTLDEAGLALRPYSDLEEGEYRVVVRRRGEGGEFGPGTVQCTFSVAEFSLSPLTALLEQHSLVSGSLNFRLRLVALSVPYEGSIELGLQCEVCGGRIVATQEATAHKGTVEASFDISHHGGPFHVQVTTPDGETASVFFPGTESTERERVTLCTLGRQAEAGLLPGEDTSEVRGLHVGYAGAQTTPLRLESAVAQVGRLLIDVRANAAQVVTFGPGKESTIYHFGPLGHGDILEFPVAAPYTLFTVGLLSEGKAYEAWGIVIRPLDLQARLLAPEKATPSEEIAIRVESNLPASCLLLVYDARLEHESPVPKLARQMIEAMRSSSAGLVEQDAPPLSSRPSAEELGAILDLDVPTFLRRSSAPRQVAAMTREVLRPRRSLARMFLSDAATLAALSASQADATPAPVEVEPEAPSLAEIASREAFPELAYLELFPVREPAERTVRLGDQIGTWRCRAYLVAGLDVQELTADVEASKAVYAELDLPASLSPGDDIVASVRYHTAQPATLTINLPGGQTISGAVLGHGTEPIHLTEPGEIMVHIWGEGGEDWSVRSVPPPGIQEVTASALEILQRGESMQAERVVVFPGPGYVLAETIEALGRYPFG